MTNSKERFVTLAAITSPHGVHGRVKLKLFTESLESFEVLCPELITESGEKIALKVTGEAGGAPVAAIDAIKNRDQAACLRGTLIGVPRRALPELDNDSFYHEDLIGLKAMNAQGEILGTVTAIDNFGAGDLVTLQMVNGEEALLALTKEIFTEINVQAGLAIIDLPEVLAASDAEKEHG